MRATKILSSLKILAALLISTAPVSAETQCASVSKDFPVKETEASASFWGNLRGHKGSISYESNAIFQEAKESSNNLARPENFCPKGCEVGKRAVFIFRSEPQKYLSTYEDSAHCLALLKKTTKNPFTYSTNRISSVDELNDWIADLSQGKGENGADLYEKCDRSCSPRFEYTIARRGEAADQYLVTASVVCGPARDKDNNMYTLDAFFRWSCEAL